MLNQRISWKGSFSKSSAEQNVLMIFLSHAGKNVAIDTPSCLGLVDTIHVIPAYRVDRIQLSLS
jgi:hypothetical protein